MPPKKSRSLAELHQQSEEISEDTCRAILDRLSAKLPPPYEDLENHVWDGGVRAEFDIVDSTASLNSHSLHSAELFDYHLLQDVSPSPISLSPNEQQRRSTSPPEPEMQHTTERYGRATKKAQPVKCILKRNNSRFKTYPPRAVMMTNRAAAV